MTMKHARLLIIADIEGSSGCHDYRASSFLTREWARACLHMSLDINAVVAALFDAGAESISIRDFHRTGYNLLPELIDSRARIAQGYRSGPVPGIGSPGQATGLMMIGMHAASGTGGFLAHTLTSRIARIQVNGRDLCEAELFASSLASPGVAPIFFSGCPIACSQAADRIPHMVCHVVEKKNGALVPDRETFRKNLACAAVASLNSRAAPYAPGEKIEAAITIRDGAAAAKKHAAPWGMKHSGDTIFLKAGDLTELYRDLIRLCYLSPLVERHIGISLALYNLAGSLGLSWARLFSGKKQFLRQNTP
jgi:D-aminopeptidase